jgi:hypothetical protein
VASVLRSMLYSMGLRSREKLRQGAIRLDECLLSDVLGFGRIAHIPHNELDEFVLVLAHQRIERALVAALDASNQAEIAYIGAHGALLPQGKWPPRRDLNRP